MDKFVPTPQDEEYMKILTEGLDGDGIGKQMAIALRGVYKCARAQGKTPLEATDIINDVINRKKEENRK
jgi:hypothetical protein